MSTEDKHKLVVDEWFVLFNGAKAWQKYHPNANSRSASVEFHRMLTNPNILAYKQQKEKELLDASRVTHLESLKYLKSALYSDPTEIIGITAEDIKELPLGLKQLISELDIKQRVVANDEAVSIEVQTIKVKFFSKKDALEMINKNIGFYEKHNQQKATVIDTSGLSSEEKKVIAKLHAK